MEWKHSRNTALRGSEAVASLAHSLRGEEGTDMSSLQCMTIVASLKTSEIIVLQKQVLQNVRVVPLLAKRGSETARGQRRALF